MAQAPANYTNENKDVRALLIGSSATAGGDVVPRIKSDKSALGNLTGTVQDISIMYKTLMKTNSVYIPKVFNDTGPETTKTKVLDSIRELFNDKKRKGFILYYSGHGKQNTGDWCFEGKRKTMDKSGNIKEEYVNKEYITLDDIINLWKNREIKKMNKKSQWLFIIADGCYSGSWVNILQNKLKPKDIMMQAACGYNECCADSLDGGLFTQAFSSQLCYRPKSIAKFTLSVVPAAIGSAIGTIIGAPITVGAAVYHSVTKSFSPVYYTTPNSHMQETFIFDSEDKQKEYWFQMTKSFAGMTFVDLFTNGAAIGSLGALKD